MKKLVTTYTFVPAAKTIQLTGYASVSLKGLLLITNVTHNIIIYHFANPALGGSVVGNTITLDYDTTTMDAGDDLQIFYDDSIADDPTAKYKLTDIDAAGGYYGHTDQFGSWYIMNLTASAARYISGTSAYTTNWGNRAILVYDYFYNIF
jgi:hypothetical protein